MSNKDIQYVHIKYKYELEVPEHLVMKEKKPKGWELTSSRKGFQRFHSPEIQSHLGVLEELGQELYMGMQRIAHSLLVTFHKMHQDSFAFLAVLSELDALVSLSKVSA